MGREDQAGEGSASGGPGASSQQAGDGAKPTQSGAPLDTENPLNDAVGFPRQSPLFHAEHAARYERQRLIEYYENEFDCRLVVISADGPDIASNVALAHRRCNSVRGAGGVAQLRLAV